MSLGVYKGWPARAMSTRCTRVDCRPGFRARGAVRRSGRGLVVSPPLDTCQGLARRPLLPVRATRH
jgi:hypothetical protein